MRLALTMLLLSCATEGAADKRDLASAALAEAYVRLLCPALAVDGGTP